MKTITKSNGLWTGSLQKHMAVSRKQMNKSYGLQQAQLARMNIVRDSQRLQLSAADTLVRLEQLKEEIKKNQYKAPPKVGTLGVIPNSNPALENTIIPHGDLYDEEIEGKPDPPKTSSPKKAKGITVEIPTIPIKKSVKTSSPTPSVASTSFSDIVEPATDQPGQLIAVKRAFSELSKERQRELSAISSKDGKDLDKILNVNPYSSPPEQIKEAIKASIRLLEKFSPTGQQKFKLFLTPESEVNYYQLKRGVEQSGDGLGRMRKRGKSGRFI